jgi:hypothetical protein
MQIFFPSFFLIFRDLFSNNGSYAPMSQIGFQLEIRVFLIGARVLPDLGRRLYGWKGGWRGWRRGRRRHGGVAAHEKEGGGALEATARV